MQIMPETLSEWVGLVGAVVTAVSFIVKVHHRTSYFGRAKGLQESSEVYAKAGRDKDASALQETARKFVVRHCVIRDRCSAQLKVMTYFDLGVYGSLVALLLLFALLQWNDPGAGEGLAAIVTCFVVVDLARRYMKLEESAVENGVKAEEAKLSGVKAPGTSRPDRGDATAG